jgi:hypothetical protein
MSVMRTARCIEVCFVLIYYRGLSKEKHRCRRRLLGGSASAWSGCGRGSGGRRHAKRSDQRIEPRPQSTRPNLHGESGVQFGRVLCHSAGSAAAQHKQPIHAVNQRCHKHKHTHEQISDACMEGGERTLHTRHVLLLTRPLRVGGSSHSASSG